MKNYSFYCNNLKYAIVCIYILLSTCNNAQTCTASFTYALSAGGVINVGSTSAGTVTGSVYSWQWGDGTSGNSGTTFSQTSHTFANNGVYQIGFTITNLNASCTNTSSSMSTIQTVTVASALCTLNLNSNFTFTNGAANSVTFTNFSTGTTSATSYLWNFGDNTTAASTNATHTYSAQGNYTVKLKAIDGFCMDSTSIAIITCNNILTAGYIYTLAPNGVVNVNSTSTGTNSNTNYTWNWGNGTPNTWGTNLSQTSYTYAINGIYSIVLSVFNPSTAACSNSLMAQSVTITSAPCSLNLNPNFTYTGGAANSISLTNTSSGTTSNTAYLWNFGDNTTASSVHANHSYTTTGTYSIKLKATDGFCKDSISKSVTICSNNIGFSYTLAPNGVVQVSSTSTGTNSSTVYSWAWGNGTQNTVGVGLSQASYTYPVNGIYSVILSVSNPSMGACTNSTSAQSVTITSALCNFGFTPNFTYLAGGAANSVTFTNVSSGTTANTFYLWDFGDNSTATSANAIHTYSTQGTYAVQLKATDGFCMDSVVIFVTVCNSNFSANFNYSLGTNGVVNFNSTSTGTNSGTYYDWEVGDGSPNSTGIAMSQTAHTYSNGGIHYVSLSIMDTTFSCFNTITNTVNVSNTPCVSNSNFNLMYSGTPGFWIAQPAYFGNIVAALWSWGDGSFSNTLFSSHTYSAAGVYNVCLTVTTSCGSSSTCVMSSIFKSSSTASQAMITINVVPAAPVPTALQENIQANQFFVNLYPNPNTGSFKLTLSSLNSKTENAMVGIYNLLGELVYSSDIKINNGKSNADIEAQNLSNGTYYVKIITDGGTYNLKTIIIK